MTQSKTGKEAMRREVLSLNPYESLTSEQIANEISISLPLLSHPLLVMKPKRRYRYILALKYLVDLKFNDNIFAKKRLDLYMSIIAPELELESIDPKRYYEAFIYCLRKHFDWFRLFTLSYSLLSDILIISGDSSNRLLPSILDKLENVCPNNKALKLENFLQSSANFSDKYSDSAISLRNSLYTNINFAISSKTKILVTGTMSSGKSTLINALVGKKVTRTMNSVCTQSVHHIYNKPFEDGYTAEFDKDLVLDAYEQLLMDNNENNDSCEIYVSTHFNTNVSLQNRVCFVDIPGVNSSEYPSHQKIACDTIKSADFDFLIYVLNADYLGTNDERNHLDFVYKNCDPSKVIFVVNKMDNEAFGDSPVTKKLQNLWNELQGIGFVEPAVYPISARFSYLLKRQNVNGELTNSERRELSNFSNIFSEKEYDLSIYNTQQPQENIFYKIGYQQLENKIIGVNNG